MCPHGIRAYIFSLTLSVFHSLRHRIFLLLLHVCSIHVTVNAGIVTKQIYVLNVITNQLNKNDRLLIAGCIVNFDTQSLNRLAARSSPLEMHVWIRHVV